MNFENLVNETLLNEGTMKVLGIKGDINKENLGKLILLNFHKTYKENPSSGAEKSGIMLVNSYFKNENGIQDKFLNFLTNFLKTKAKNNIVDLKIEFSNNQLIRVELSNGEKDSFNIKSKEAETQDEYETKRGIKINTLKDTKQQQGMLKMNQFTN